jgi:predicted TIM-barrel fold metal-dependent hydrolase
MSSIAITNCHIHTFTEAHVPRAFPHPLVAPLKRVPAVTVALSKALRFLGRDRNADTLERLARFQTETLNDTQIEAFANACRHYPRGTRFVVLPMDMALSGHGAPRVDIRAQHAELARLRDAHPDQVIPFAAVDPRRPDAVDILREAFDAFGFRGLKLYPRLGYPPDHPVLMRHVYPMLVARGLPVMTHCSRGGVAERGLVAAKADRYSAPQAWKAVWADPDLTDLRVCLGHFGGQRDWMSYVRDGIHPDDPDAMEANWLVAIRRMIEGGAYPNLWTDISYTLFQTDDFLPFLKIFLAQKAVAARVLFGSDFYMTRQEDLSERAVCIRIRVALGEETFQQIAEHNPAIWLGERA